MTAKGFLRFFFESPSRVAWAKGVKGPPQNRAQEARSLLLTRVLFVGVSERQVPPCLGCALSQNACLALPCTDPECIQCLTSLSTIPNLSNVTVPASCRANSQACAIMQCVNNACAGVCGVVSCSLATCTPIGGLCTTSTSCCGYTRVNPEPPAKTCGSLESPLLVRCFVSHICCAAAARCG